MYLRFVTNRTDPDSHQPQGVFACAYTLLKSGDMTPAEHAHLTELLEWFEENLPIPRSSRITDRATFWYYEWAREPICRMWELANLLEARDVFVSVQSCKTLGCCLYRDAFQVAAYPSAYNAPVRTR